MSPAQRCAWETQTTLLLCPVPCTFMRLRWAWQAAALCEATGNLAMVL